MSDEDLDPRPGSVEKPSFLNDAKFWTAIERIGRRAGARFDDLLARELAALSTGDEDDPSPVFLEDREFWAMVQRRGERARARIGDVLAHEEENLVINRSATDTDKRWDEIVSSWERQGVTNAPERSDAPEVGSSKPSGDPVLNRGWHPEVRHAAQRLSPPGSSEESIIAAQLAEDSRGAVGIRPPGKAFEDLEESHVQSDVVTLAKGPEPHPDPRSMSSAPDDVLMAGFGVGDPEATTTFVRRYQARVYALACAVVGDRALAEDVTQEVFLRAWREASSYNPRKGSVPSWLLTMTRNLAVDGIKRGRPEPVDPAMLADLEVRASESSGPVARAEVSEEVRGLRSILAGLPADQSRALLLAAVCGRTASEIAESEGIPLGTAKTRIRAGLMKVRSALTAAERESS